MQKPRRNPLMALVPAALPVFFLLSPGSVSAEPTRFASRPESRLYLSGDSTLHKFQSVAHGLVAVAEMKGDLRSGDLAAMRSAIFNGKMSGFIVQVPVLRLKSDHDGLDENLQKALKATENPEITFKMTSYEAYSAGEDTRIMIQAQGLLRVAGKERKTMIQGIVNLTGDSFTITGSKELFMSEFDVHPPVLFIGTVKTADKVIIHFNLKMTPLRK